MTLQVQAFPLAPRDGNLFVITNIRAGSGPSAFRASGVAVAANVAAGINPATLNTNQFTSKNLGFDDAVSLESLNPTSRELPFEWGTLPTANRERIRLQFFPPLNPLGAAQPSYRDFSFPRIVFP